MATVLQQARPRARRTKKTSKPRVSVYQVITDRILELLDQGIVPWHKTWGGRAYAPQSLTTGKSYRGINAFLLFCAGFEDPHFVTFRQAKALKGTIRKGEKAMPVLFYQFPEDRQERLEELQKAGQKPGEEEYLGPIVRYYRVFNVAQCDDLDSNKVPKVEQPSYHHNPIAEAEAILAASPVQVKVTHGYRGAAYVRDDDAIIMPPRERFEKAEHYYATLFHEMIHATGAPSRLNRTKGKQFGDADYAREELVAEMGAAFLCGHCGIVDRTVDNSAAYIDNWRRVLKGNAKLVVEAAAKAQKAADMILGVSWDKPNEEKEQPVCVTAEKPAQGMLF